MEYNVIYILDATDCRAGINNIKAAVNAAMSEGWTPIGGISVQQRFEDRTNLFQAMSRTKAQQDINN